jgi:hypothetical protein
MIVPHSDKVPLTSADQASELGFADGKKLRSNGAKPAALEFNIEVESGQYLRSEFYSAWETGFRRGYLEN